MWNEEKSVGLTRICTLAFMALLIAVVATAPWLTSWFISISRAPLEGSQPLFMVTIYTGALPAGLRYLSIPTLPLMFDFPLDMARVPAEVNRLSNQTLVTTYEREWGKVSGH